MVAKTRRKRSVGTKRIKTAKRRKNNTRSKRGRTAKRGGMPPSAAAARIARRIAPRVFDNIITGHNPLPDNKELVINGRRYFGLPGDIPSPSVKERVYNEYNEKTENPVEMLGVADSAFSAAHKAMYNDELHAKYQTPTHTRRQPIGSGVFSTPQQRRMLYDNENHTPSGRPMKYSTPAGPSSDLSSPPPPRDDLSIRGNRLPYNPMDFADMAARNPIQKLDFGDEFKTPESSPYSKSASSLQKTFKKKLGEHRSDTASSPPPTPPRFRI